MSHLSRSLTEFREFGRSFISYPNLSLKELSRFLLNSLGIKQKPGNGVLFESHCHTNFPCKTPNGLNDGMPLEKLIGACFNKGIELLSITDHRNCDAFDSLANKGLKGYDIEKTDDKRYVIIYNNTGNIILLRSAEFWTD